VTFEASEDDEGKMTKRTDLGNDATEHTKERSVISVASRQR
jgi:hypothetical protein